MLTRKDSDGNVVLVDGAEEYVIEPLDLKSDWPAIEAHLAALRRKPLEALQSEMAEIEKLPPWARDRMVDRAYADLRSPATDKPTRRDVMDWLDSLDGMIYAVWYQIKKRRPAFSLGDATELLTRAAKDQLLKRIFDESNMNGQAGKIVAAARAAGIDVAGMADRNPTPEETARLLAAAEKAGINPAEVLVGM